MCWLNFYRRSVSLADCWSPCQPLSLHPFTSISDAPELRRGHAARTHNEGKWGSKAWKSLKFLIYLTVSRLLRAASRQPPRGSESFGGESSVSPPQKILFLFNGCDMIDSLELLCPRPWRTGTPTAFYVSVRLWPCSQASAMQLLVCPCFVFFFYCQAKYNKIIYTKWKE